MNETVTGQGDDATTAPEAGAARAGADGAGGAPTGGALLVAELWYASPPDLADPALLDSLQVLSPDAEAQDGSLVLPHPSISVELETGTLPLLTTVFAASAVDGVSKTLPDVGQTWDWPEAEEQLAGCTGSILVTEMLAAHFTPQQRVHALGTVVAKLIETTAPRAVAWPQSQRVTEPAAFEPGDLNGVLNVRFFTIASPDGSEDASAPVEQAMIMDTLGLHVFDLPDLQCHYRDFDPAQVAALLFSTASYVFDAGDVIDDGHTISGLQGDERYVCQHEEALLAPVRRVLDVDLGDPYAAGARDR